MPGTSGEAVTSAPCVLFEDDDLLVVQKPAGVNTHAPNPYAGEGIYEWLRHREPRWASLGIIHRLDKDTSGVMVFSKTTAASKALTEQFTGRTIHKQYLLITDRRPPSAKFTVKSCLVRAGERYVARPVFPGGDVAETRFHAVDLAEVAGPEVGARFPGTRFWALLAEPVTGRTHQIRVHAAEKSIPILGDTLYGGTPSARVFLHAQKLTVRHPQTGQTLRFEARVLFANPPELELRAAFIEPSVTNAFRVLNGASDGWPGCYVEKLGDYLLSESAHPLNEDQFAELSRLAGELGAQGACHKILSRRVRGAGAQAVSPRHVLGAVPAAQFEIRENGLRYEASFAEGYSYGLFLDQRDNRRRLQTGHIAAGFELSTGRAHPLTVLNTFAYTCAFSVSAAASGGQATSLDLSKKYLEWGRRNFALNSIDLAGQDFIYGDVFDWLRRLAKKGRKFDVVLLDPPTFSQSRESGVFQAERDYATLVKAALGVLNSGGVLLASCNTQGWPPEAFASDVESVVKQAGWQITQRHYAPQPPDFPVSRAEPAYLKTLWLRLGTERGRQRQ
jgi:23S rRNA (cytosine1962-C5)-methyltransferase